jgi:hypothetical protein
MPNGSRQAPRQASARARARPDHRRSEDGDRTGDATEAGAAGVVFGRNIWQSGGMRGMIRALNSIIHEGRLAAEALAESDLA